MREQALGIMFLIFFVKAQPVMAFVVLSGPDEAILTDSADQPTVTFYWDGSAPAIKDVDQLEDGRFIGLDDISLMREIIGLAFQKWNEVPGSYLQLQLVEELSAVLDADDLRHSILVKQEENLTTAAFALPIITEEKIIDCDISISSKETPAKVLAYTMIHEVGHCVGLGHAHTNYGAIMGYARRPGALHLGADDMAGIIYLYTDPGYETERKEFLACAVLGKKQGGHVGMSFLLFFFFPLVLAGLWITGGSLNRH